MKILVTGGAGFIGSRVVDGYINRGHKVAVLDNLSSGFRKNLNPKAAFYKVDIRSLESVRKVLSKEKPQVVNHHAAIAEIARSLKDPGSTYEVNILGTANILRASGELAVKKFIFTSTGGAIYGNPRFIPVKESAEPNPLSPYALSKLAGEEMVRFYSKFFKFDYTILRYANVYGPRQNPKGEAGVVAIFTDLMKSGIRPTIFGDGNSTRDYVYVGDVAAANILALNRGKNSILNIGCGKEISTKQVFRAISHGVGFVKKPTYVKARGGEVRRIALDVSSAKKNLKWHPRTSFKEGVAKYISVTYQ